MKVDQFDSLKDTIRDFNRALEAADLLERVYLALGPYDWDKSDINKFDKDLGRKINDFFEFDDSE